MHLTRPEVFNPPPAIFSHLMSVEHTRRLQHDGLTERVPEVRALELFHLAAFVHMPDYLHVLTGTRHEENIRHDKREHRIEKARQAGSTDETWDI